MRLTNSQADFIRDSVMKNFGTASRLWLFGSRVDEQRKGGDIDLYIEPEFQDPTQLIDAKLRFLRDLHLHLGEQKIDVVIRRAALSEDLPIFRVARDTGIRLL